MTDHAEPLESIPEPFTLAAGYPRHAPGRTELRESIRQVTSGHDWARLSWVELVEALLAVGRTDIPLGRLAEGHIDAVRIADQAGRTLQPDALYGVWASRSGATGVRASRHRAALHGDGDGDRDGDGDGDGDGLMLDGVMLDGQMLDGLMLDGLMLDGTIKFASGAGVIDRALLPVWLEDDRHLLVDLDVRELPVDRSAWQTGAMSVSQSHTVPVDQVEVPAVNVLGRPNFYLDRPGFFPGGVGVAAVWAGGLARILDCVLDWLGERRSAAGDLRLGRIATARSLAVAAARQGAERLDAAPADASGGQLQQLSTQVRAGVATAVHNGLAEARTLAGPAGLAFDADLTHGLDDLGLYVLQQNADGDAAYLAEMLRTHHAPGTTKQGRS